jgi:hypothetical protein
VGSQRALKPDIQETIHNGNITVLIRMDPYVQTIPSKPSQPLTIPTGLFPFLGYHHVLMIFIAISIVLLCKSPPTTFPLPIFPLPLPLLSPLNLHNILTFSSAPPSRLLLLLPRHPQHLPNLPLLLSLPPHLRPLPSGPRRYHRNCKHSRPSHARSTRRILRNLCKPKRGFFPV